MSEPLHVDTDVLRAGARRFDEVATKLGALQDAMVTPQQIQRAVSAYGPPGEADVEAAESLNKVLPGLNPLFEEIALAVRVVGDMALQMATVWEQTEDMAEDMANGLNSGAVTGGVPTGPPVGPVDAPTIPSDVPGAPDGGGPRR